MFPNRRGQRGAGFERVRVYGPHEKPDGDFPNVPGHVANPENPAVLTGPITATQYALLSSLAAVPLRTLGATSGVLAEGLGWPWFFVLTTAVVGGVLLIGVDTLSALLMGVIAITVVPTRQLLMPAINAATDRGDKSRFKWLHGVSVLITLTHIALAGWALALLV